MFQPRCAKSPDFEVKLNTLGKKGTTKAGHNVVLVRKEGADFSNNEALLGRLKRKTITQSNDAKNLDSVKVKGEDKIEK